MTILRHRRFVWAFAECTPRIGVVEQPAMYVQIRAFLGDVWQGRFRSEDAAFEATFKHASRFVAWIDKDWVETPID